MYIIGIQYLIRENDKFTIFIFQHFKILYQKLEMENVIKRKKTEYEDKNKTETKKNSNTITKIYQILKNYKNKIKNKLYHNKN